MLPFLSPATTGQQRPWSLVHEGIRFSDVVAGRAKPPTQPAERTVVIVAAVTAKSSGASTDAPPASKKAKRTRKKKVAPTNSVPDSPAAATPTPLTPSTPTAPMGTTAAAVPPPPSFLTASPGASTPAPLSSNAAALATVDMATAFRRAALAALERPLASNDRLANWLDAALDHLKGFFRVFDIRFEGSPYDMSGRMGPAIREALLGAKVPPAARRFLTSYLEQGPDGILFSTAAKEFRASSRSPERDFTELVRIFDIRQSQRQSLTEYLDDFTALTTPVAGYRLPLEVQGILFLRSLADDNVRQMTLRLMAETGDSPLGARLELDHVAGIAGRAELMVPTLRFSRPGHSRSPTGRAAHQRQPRGRDNNHNRSHRAGPHASTSAAPLLTGANAASTGGIRRCYKCRRIGHDAEGCRTVVASIPADSAFRALLDSGHLAIFIVEGTLLHRRGHTG